MKTLLLFLIYTFSFQGFAQDPELYQTWYLTDYYLDLKGEFEVSDIDPQITPILTITENLGGGDQKLYLSNEIFSGMNFSNNQLSVSENELSNFKIFPNPVTDIIIVSSENSSLEKLSVYSVSGMKVLEQIAIENSIDVSRLQNGIYFLEITSSEVKTVRKFIKK